MTPNSKLTHTKIKTIHQNEKNPLNVQDERSLNELLNLTEQQASLLEAGFQFREMMMVYNSAIKEVHTKLEILNDELTIRYGKNTIESISSRIKTPASIINKLRLRGAPFTPQAVRTHIDDVAGVRVICSFIDDIYDVAEMLLRQDDIRLLSRKDYIESPKPNGYRSLHLLVEVPVFFSNDKQHLKVEIQLRTIAMDFWASLEHQMKYKKQVDCPGMIERELKECSEIIAGVDHRMQRIREMITQQKDCTE